MTREQLKEYCAAEFENIDAVVAELRYDGQNGIQ